MYLSIDPGISTGYAWWNSKTRQLEKCGAAPDYKATQQVDSLIIEVPKIYTARMMKGDPNNIVTLALQVGRYIERFGTNGLHTVYPNEWKGTQTKGAHHPKIFMALSDKEKEIVRCAGSGLHEKALGDMFDALGLGLYARDMGYWK